MTQTSERHDALAANFTRLAEGTTDWTVPTPVREWQAADIVDHLTTWLPGFLGQVGVQLDQVSPDLAPAERFAQHSQNVQALLTDEARAGVEIDDPMGGGRKRVDEVLAGMYLPDIFMHSVDLAWATGQESGLDQTEVAQMAAGMGASIDSLAASGQFGTPKLVDDSHTPEQRLMAVIGRDENWQRPSLAD